MAAASRRKIISYDMAHHCSGQGAGRTSEHTGNLKVFGAGQINLSIPDRFGNTVKPREWFIVPLNAIDEAVQRIRDRSILKYLYDPQAGQLVNAFLPPQGGERLAK